MNEPQKKKKLKTMTYEEALEEYAEDLARQEAERHREGSLESPEGRKERLKARIKDNMHVFNDRFAKGYEVLLEEIFRKGH